MIIPSVSLPNALAAQLDVMCRRTGKTSAAMLRAVLTEYVLGLNSDYGVTEHPVDAKRPMPGVVSYAHDRGIATEAMKSDGSRIYKTLP